MSPSRRILALLLPLGACEVVVVPPAARTPVATEQAEPVALVDDVAWVTRASLDLRGVRPSAADLARAAAGEAEAVVETYVADPRLGLRVAWIYDDLLHTALFFDNSQTRSWVDLAAEDRHAVGWQPLALVQQVVEADRPATELVLAAELPRNDRIAGVFGWTAPGSGDAWVPMPHDDPRPAVGLLSSSTLWFAYDGDQNNYNRRRAAFVSKAFACSDFLERDLVFEGALDPSDLGSLETAVSSQSECQTCHAGLDPLAYLFGGFPERSHEDARPALGIWSPLMDEWTREAHSTGWFGRPVASLGDLGPVIAADPRFARCTVQTVARGLLGGAALDPVQLDAWTLAFTDQDAMVIRSLAGRVVASEAYRADEERTLTPEQLQTVVADLVGLDPDGPALSPVAWSTEHRLLGGGTDDAMALVRVRAPAVGHALLLQWIARGVAAEALEEDATRDAGGRVLWTEVEPWATEGVAAQVAAWHTRFLSVPVTAEDERVAALVALWEEVGGADEPETAWAAVMHALLRHPRALVY